MNPAIVLRQATARLRAAGVPDPVRDARILLAHAMALPPSRLTLHLDRAIPEDTARAFDALIDQRAGRRPVSRITGGRLFFDHRFEITPDVLDPRPETETLVRLALDTPFATVLDLGTGSGAIVLSLLAARPNATGTGTDISPAALAVAARNARALGLADRIRWRRCDWFSGVDGVFDLIVANPPYIAADEIAGLAPEVRNFDPPCALSDGGDGLGAYRRIAARARRHLSPGGRLAVEIGPDQAAAVVALVAAAGFATPDIHQDLDGRDRVVSGRNPS